MTKHNTPESPQSSAESVGVATLTPAVPGDAEKLTLRAEDAAEVSSNWKAGVEAQIAQGQAMAAWDGDELIALFGVARGPGLLSPWLLASDRLKDFKAQLMREAAAFIDDLRATGCTVGNHIGKGAASNRWFIQRLGFVIIGAPGGTHDFFYLPGAGHV